MKMYIYGHLLILCLGIHIVTACDQQVDIIFIIDGSESVTSSSFIQQKAFVASQTLWYPISPSHVKLGLILFSTNVTDIIHLHPFKSDREFRRSVTQLSHPSHGSSIHIALRTLRRIFVDEGRKNAKKVGILITDGKSRTLWNTFKEAKLLRLSDISMITIGVGNRISVRELSELTKDRGTFLRINSFEGLFVLSEKIRQLICPYVVKQTTIKMIADETTTLKTVQVHDGLKLKSFFDPYEHIDTKTKLNDVPLHQETVIDSDTSEENITSDFVTDAPVSSYTKEVINVTNFVTSYLTTRNVTNFTFPVVATSNMTTFAASTTTPQVLSTMSSISSIVEVRHTQGRKFSNSAETRSKKTITQKTTSWDSLLSLLSSITGTSEVQTSFINSSSSSVKKEIFSEKLPLLPPIRIPTSKVQTITSTVKPNDVDSTKLTQSLTTPISKISPFQVPKQPLRQLTNRKTLSKSKDSIPSITLFSLDFDVNDKTRSRDNLWQVASILNAKSSASIPSIVHSPSVSKERVVLNEAFQAADSKKAIMKKELRSQGLIYERGDRIISKPSSLLSSSSSKTTLSSTYPSSTSRQKDLLSSPYIQKKKIVNRKGKRKKNRKLYKQKRRKDKSSGMKPFKSPSVGLIDRLLFSSRLISQHLMPFGRHSTISPSRRSDNQFYRREVSFLPSSEYRERIIRGMSDVTPSDMNMEPTAKRESQVCNNKPFARDSRYYLERVVGTKYEIRPCPDGTAYDARTCGCTIRTLVNGNRECRPELQMDFKRDFRDSSGKNTAVADSKVELKNGNAIFNGHSTISVWRFAGTYIGNNLMIKLLFKPKKSPITRQTLVGNCAKGRTMSYGIEIDRVEEVAIFKVDTIPRSSVSVKVPIKLQDWNDVTLIYDGLDLTGLNYEKRGSKPLAGPIETRSAPLYIGGCSSNNGFVGEIDAIAIYFCSPQRKMFLG